MYNTLFYEVKDQVATITFHRPEVYHAFNEEMGRELLDALMMTAADLSIRVLILTGSGEKAFCSGEDLKAGGWVPTGNFRKVLHTRYNPIILRIREMPKPVICRLNGVAAGAGCSIVLACDVVIAAESASLVEGFIHLGLVPDAGSTYFLSRALGYLKAFELATKGGKISAREALALGLVSQVVPAEELDGRVAAEAAYFASAPTMAIAMIKRLLQKSTTGSLQSQLQYEAQCQQMAGETRDYTEGIHAFLEKRKPRFRGQ